MKTYILKREQVVPRSRQETFAFFADAFNLERITPPFLRFRILTSPPIVMGGGALIDYRLALFGVPFKWRTLIEEWSPETHFIDRQISGPYALWHHTHTFEDAGPNSTLMKDIVRYQIPFGPIGSLAHRFFVRQMLDRIFDYRREATMKILGKPTESLTGSQGVA